MNEHKAITSRLNELAGVTEPKGRNEFKHGYAKGDMVYYNRYTGNGRYMDTIPCEVVRVTAKTLVLDDGERTYSRVRPNSVYLQTIGK